MEGESGGRKSEKSRTWKVTWRGKVKEAGMGEDQDRRREETETTVRRKGKAKCWEGASQITLTETE